MPWKFSTSGPYDFQRTAIAMIGKLLLLDTLPHEPLVTPRTCFHGSCSGAHSVYWPVAPGKSTLLDILAQRKGGAVTGKVQQLGPLQPQHAHCTAKRWLTQML